MKKRKLVSKKPVKRVFQRSIMIDDDKIQVNIYKKGKTTFVRDRKTGYIISRSRKLNTRQILKELSYGKIFTKRVIAESRVSGIERDVKFRIRQPLLKIGVFGSKRLKNGSLKVKTKRIRKGYMGQLEMAVLFVSSNGRKVTCQGLASRNRDLSDPDQYQTSFNEAYSGALKHLNFSPVKQDIIWIHFYYYDV